MKPKAPVISLEFQRVTCAESVRCLIDADRAERIILESPDLRHPGASASDDAAEHYLMVLKETLDTRIPGEPKEIRL